MCYPACEDSKVDLNLYTHGMHIWPFQCLTLNTKHNFIERMNSSEHLNLNNYIGNGKVSMSYPTGDQSFAVLWLFFWRDFQTRIN